MGLFNWIFGKKPAAPPPPPEPAKEVSSPRLDEVPPPAKLAFPPAPRPTLPKPSTVEGPPEYVRAVELQRAYWTHNPQEQWLLESRGLEQLNWRERLRLHHLCCLQRLVAGTDQAVLTEKCQVIVKRLLEADSPYRPRTGMIWRAPVVPPMRQKPPDMQGVLVNASLSHLGSLEVYRVDGTNQPTSIDFVSFDELSGIMFAPPKIIRGAKLFYEDGRTEILLVPLLYGTTWELGSEQDRAGKMTRFVSYLEGEAISAVGAAGMGIGQQDFSLRSPDGAVSLFGVGAAAEVAFPLDMRDPRFEQKARARGIDPEVLRKQVNI